MPVAIQSLSELERARLQEVAFSRLHQDYDLGCQITMPKGGDCFVLFNAYCRLELNSVTSFLCLNQYIQYIQSSQSPLDNIRVLRT